MAKRKQSCLELRSSWRFGVTFGCFRFSLATCAIFTIFTFLRWCSITARSEGTISFLLHVASLIGPTELSLGQFDAAWWSMDLHGLPCQLDCRDRHICKCHNHSFSGSHRRSFSIFRNTLLVDNVSFYRAAWDLWWRVSLPLLESNKTNNSIQKLRWYLSLRMTAMSTTGPDNPVKTARVFTSLRYCSLPSGPVICADTEYVCPGTTTDGLYFNL